MTGIAFELTSEVSPPKQFLFDGIPYELKGVDHLSPKEEAAAMALFARHGILAVELDSTRNAQKGEEIATALRNTRLNIIYHLTTIPEGTPLPLHVQLKLLEAAMEEFGTGEEKAETPVDAPAEAATTE